MIETAEKRNTILDTLIMLGTLAYFTLYDGITILVGKEGSRLGGLMLIACVFFVFLVFLLKTRGDIGFRVNILFVYFIMLSGYCLLNCLWASYRSAAFTRTTNLIEIFAVAFIFYLVYKDKGNVDELLRLYMISKFFLITLALLVYGWGYISKLMRSSERLTNDVINANTIGMAAGYALVIFAYFLLNKRIRIWWIPFAGISLFMLLLSQSRKGILILALGILGIVFFNICSKKKTDAFYVKAIVIALLFAAALIVLIRTGALSGIADRLTGMLGNISSDVSLDKSTQMRHAFREIGVQLFHEHPIGGVGIDNARYFTTHLYNKEYHLHNNYYEMMADGGILGIAFYYWIYVVMFFGMIKYRNIKNHEFNLCFVLLVIRLIMDYGFYSYKSRGTYIFLIILFICFENQKKAYFKKKEMCE